MPQAERTTESSAEQEQAATDNKRARRNPLVNSPMDPKIIDGVNIMQLGLSANAVDALVNDNLNDVLSGKYGGIVADAELFKFDFVEDKRGRKRERPIVSRVDRNKDKVRKSLQTCKEKDRWPARGGFGSAFDRYLATNEEAMKKYKALKDEPQSQKKTEAERKKWGLQHLTALEEHFSQESVATEEVKSIGRWIAQDRVVVDCLLYTSDAADE